MLVLASDQSSGEIRSCSGPSNRRMNAAETRCGPAVTAIGSVLRFTPSGSDVFIQRSISSSATRDAVDGDLYLLGRVRRVQRRTSVPVQRAGRLVIEGHPEPVVAIGRERVHDRDAAARAIRRALDMLPLRRPSRDRIGRFTRGRRGIADGQTADFGGRGEVGLHQGRRQQLRVGNVVEVRALRVERQVVAGIHVEREQIADGSRVLGAIEPLEARAARAQVPWPARQPALRADRPDPRAQLRRAACCPAAASDPPAVCGSSSR